MKDRFELVYYIVFMILLVGGLSAGIVDEILNANFEYYVKYIGIGFLMTLARFIYNGKHFWNPPMEIPKDWLILIVFIFIFVATLIVFFIEDSIRYSF